jgi:hypothetical protein
MAAAFFIFYLSREDFEGPPPLAVRLELRIRR